MTKKLFAALLAAMMLLSICAVSNAEAASTFTGKGVGHNGDVMVEVGFDADGKIISVQATEENETPNIAKSAYDVVPAAIVANNSVNVQVVSGATMTSCAIITAVEDAIAQAGYDVANYQAEAAKTGEAVVIDTDIVIVGAGGAGLSAAIEAAGQGAKVVMIDTTGYVGGASAVALGMIVYADETTEANGKKVLTPEELCAGLKEYGSEYFNDALALDFLKHSKENIDWFKALDPSVETKVNYAGGNFSLNGLEPTEFTYASLNAGDSTPTTYYVDMLCNAAVSAGAEIMLNTTADAILTDETGAVCGIHAIGQNGNDYTISAKKVILASGGYGADIERVVAHSEMTAPVYMGPSSNMGFGIVEGEKLGAKLEYTFMPDLPGYNQAVYSTYGGLVVNENAEVLNEQDEAIANLYAAGELTCVQIIDPYHFAGGENLAWNLYSGRIAGQQAAESIR